MPVKSVREMSEAERKRHSIGAKAFRSTIVGSLLLVLVIVAIGLALYVNALVDQYTRRAFDTSCNVEAILRETVDVRPLSEEVLSIYKSMTEEERAQVGTEAYRSRFAALTKREDYADIRTVLGAFLESSDAYAVYLAIYDKDTSAIVYVVDPEEGEAGLLPGDWEPVDPRGLEKFLTWDGTGMLYDIGYTELYGFMCTAGVPAYAEGDRHGVFVNTDVTLNQIVEAASGFALQYALVFIVLAVLFGWLRVRNFLKTFVNPINAIAQAAQDYVHDHRVGNEVGDHFSSLDIRTGDEVENLNIVMAEMEHDIARYVDDLTKATAEEERIKTELELANRIQTSMLPNEFPPFPDRKEIDLYAIMTPAKEVGGDFYDFFFVDDDHLALVVADVSGKGVPAAMFMVMAKGMIQTQAMTGYTPASVLSDVNNLIYANNREKMFVTAWLGILELSTGKLVAANAGHEYPIIKRPDGPFELLKDKHGFVLGGKQNMKYFDCELMLAPGSQVFVCTDGLTEATNGDLDLFGRDRAVDALNGAAGCTPEELLRAVNAAVDEFVGDEEQFDDLTMLCIEYRGSS